GELRLPAVWLDDLPLLVAGFGLELPHFGVDVAVDEEEIEPSVVIEIDERGAPAEPARVHADARGKRAVVAQAAAAVLVERRRVAGEVRLEDVHRAVAIVVADGDAHARLRLAVLAVGAARGDGDVG